MKIISWNVNGLRASLKKGFLESFDKLNADIFCIQEIKLQNGQIDLALEKYKQYWNYAEKKGYSGTAVFTRLTPNKVNFGFGSNESDKEGRVITLEFDSFYLVNVYTPNSQRGLVRLEHRINWEDTFRNYLIELNKSKPIILCGDLNVAHQEIDLANPKSNKKNAGFSDEERSKMNKFLETGFIDTFRYLYPDKQDAYTWWSYMRKARERNVGWRIDYFIVSDSIKEYIKDSIIHSDIMGSDHCPVELKISL